MFGFPFRRRAAPAVCPGCRVALLGFEWGGVELDRCPRCGGTWLDAGEMETLLRLSRCSASAETIRISGITGTATPQGRCPRCGRRLGNAVAGSGAGVPVARCGSGHGVWVETASLQESIERFSQGAEGAVARQLAEICRAGLPSSADAPDTARGR